VLLYSVCSVYSVIIECYYIVLWYSVLLLLL